MAAAPASQCAWGRCPAPFWAPGWPPRAPRAARRPTPCLAPTNAQTGPQRAAHRQLDGCVQGPQPHPPPPHRHQGARPCFALGPRLVLAHWQRRWQPCAGAGSGCLARGERTSRAHPPPVRTTPPAAARRPTRRQVYPSYVLPLATMHTCSGKNFNRAIRFWCNMPPPALEALVKALNPTGARRRAPRRGDASVIGCAHGCGQLRLRPHQRAVLGPAPPAGCAQPRPPP